MITYTNILPPYFAPERDSTGKAINTDVVKWSGRQAPPAIGASIHVSMNRLGSGTVEGYFVEENWLGVTVKLIDPPEWWLKQNASKPNRLAHVFGTEIREAA